MKEQIKRLFVEKKPEFAAEAKKLAADARDFLGAAGLAGVAGLAGALALGGASLLRRRRR